MGNTSILFLFEFSDNCDMKFLAFSAALLFVTLAVEGSFLPFLQSPRHDGIRRVCHLEPGNFTTVISASEIAVVFFTAPSTVPVQQFQCPTELESFAEVTAQVLRKKNIVVCKASADSYASLKLSDFATTKIDAGDIYIYKKTRGLPYYGRRSISTLLSFLFKVNDTQVNVIRGKIDKITFDAVQQTKVVGFFMLGTADFSTFEDAAAKLSPYVTFYAVFDRAVAKHLKLDTVGQIHLFKSFGKNPVVCPQNPATASDIKAFIKGTKGAILTEMTEHNMYNPQLLDPSKTLVLIIAEQTTSMGGYFYHLITRLIQNNTENTDFEALNIVWIEPKVFPTIHLVIDELEAVFGIPNKLPAFGTINMTTLQSAWLNTALLNVTADKASDSDNLKVLQDWLTGIMNNSAASVKTGLQSFVESPSSQILTEGSNAVLECVIENPVGDCLWLRNGQNIGFNLKRHPQYSWRGDTTTGDCTLLINGVQKGRDDGEWVCEITGDRENPTLTSMPARVVALAPAMPTKTEL